MSDALIIGGGGFLGANLALGLGNLGYRISIAGPRPLAPAIVRALPQVLSSIIRLSEVEELELLLSSRRPDIVIHMVSTMTPGSSEHDLLRERREVLTPTVQLIGLLARKNIPLIFFSSGGAIYGPSEKERLNERDECKPISYYGQTKLELESYIRFANRMSGLRYLIVRPSNPYGLFQSIDGNQGLISAILGKLKRKETLSVWGDGRTVRDYIHVDDLVKATCAILKKDVWNDTINIGSGIGHSLLDVVSATEKAIGRVVPLTFLPPRTADVDKIILDVTRLVSLDAFYQRELETGIRDYASALGFCP